MNFEESYTETLFKTVSFETFVEERGLLFQDYPLLLVRPKNEPPNLNLHDFQISRMSASKEVKGCYKVKTERQNEVDELIFFQNDLLMNEEEAFREIKKKKFEAFLASTTPILHNPEERITALRDVVLKSFLHLEHLDEQKEKAENYKTSKSSKAGKNKQKKIILEDQLIEPVPQAPAWNLDHLDTCLDDIVSRSDTLEHFNKSKVERTSAHAFYCLQKADGDLGTISYLIDGAPKVWYGFLAKDTERIVQYLKKNYPDDYTLCQEAHQHKRFFLDPEELKSFLPDLKVFKIIQPAGHYLITAPGSFFQGFNLGCNLAQTVNFGTSNWKNSWAKAKLCHCIPRMWNTKTLMMEQRRNKFGEAEDDRRERVEASLNENTGKFKDVLNMNVNSYHYAKYRANSFAVIAQVGVHRKVQRALANLAQISSPGKFILIPTSEPVETRGAYTWQIYRSKFKRNPHATQELTTKKLQKRFKNNKGKVFLTQENSLGDAFEELNFISYSSAEETSSYEGENGIKIFIQEEEITTVKETAIDELKTKLQSKKATQKSKKTRKTAPKKPIHEISAVNENEEIQVSSVMISLNRLLANNPDYAVILQDCLIMPRYSSAEKESPAKDNVNDVLKPELLKNINSFELAEICCQLKDTNLAILARVTERYHQNRQQINAPPPPQYTDIKNLISIWCTPASDHQGFDFVLVDGTGVIRLSSRVGASKEERADFWARYVTQFFSEGKETVLICQDFQRLRHLFGTENDVKLNSILIRETCPMKNQIMTLMGNKEEFRSLELSSKSFLFELDHLIIIGCTIEDLTRFQRYYCFHPSQFSRDDLCYFSRFSSNSEERHFLLCFEEQLETNYWALCLIDSLGYCVLSRTSEESGENLDINVYRIMMEVVRATDKIFYFKDMNRFQPLRQLRFFYTQATPPKGFKTTKPKLQDLLKEGKEIHQSWVWENRHIGKYAAPPLKRPLYQSLC